MEKIALKCSDRTISSGRLCQDELDKYGSVIVVFYFGKKTVGVDIAGVSSINVYYLNPINKAQRKANAYFISRFVDKCEDNITLKNKIQ